MTNSLLKKTNSRINRIHCYLKINLILFHHNKKIITRKKLCKILLINKFKIIITKIKVLRHQCQQAVVDLELIISEKILGGV